jgi:L-threonate 2-dehydrogenase
MPSTVAFVGLGAMGSGMARCLARSGVTVRAYDVRPEPVRAFAEDTGSIACSSAKEAGEHADAAILVVLNADQAQSVVFDEHGLAASLPRDTPVVCMTTMAPARARELAEQAREVGLRWIDAPISGGTERAAAGSLTTMVGAAANDLEQVRPLLEAFSRDVFHLGPVGAGSTTKLVNQVLVYCNLAATAEAVALSRKLGADLQTIYDVIRTAVGTSAIFEARVPKILDGTYASGGSMRIALKDLGIAEETARELGMPMPMTAQATQLFRAAAASGMRDGDDLGVARLLEQLAGL